MKKKKHISKERSDVHCKIRRTLLIKELKLFLNVVFIVTYLKFKLKLLSLFSTIACQNIK